MNTDDGVTRPRLAAVNRRQMVMRAMDVEQLIEPDHPARSIWELVGRLDLSRYYAAIAAVEGRAGRDHTDPQVLISLWLYAYRGNHRGNRGQRVPDSSSLVLREFDGRFYFSLPATFLSAVTRAPLLAGRVVLDVKKGGIIIWGSEVHTIPLSRGKRFQRGNRIQVHFRLFHSLLHAGLSRGTT
jgi:hypothetical protein